MIQVTRWAASDIGITETTVKVHRSKGRTLTAQAKELTVMGSTDRRFPMPEGIKDLASGQP